MHSFLKLVLKGSTELTSKLTICQNKMNIREIWGALESGSVDVYVIIGTRGEESVL